MKVLYVSGGDDYHFLTFEQQDESVKQEVIAKCESEPDKTHSFSIEEDDSYFYAKLIEFGEIDPKFIEFLESIKDHDASKHSNWIVIE